MGKACGHDWKFEIIATKEQIKKPVDIQILQLNKKEQWEHFAPSLFLLFSVIIFVSLFFMLKYNGQTKQDEYMMIPFIIGSLLITLLSFWHRKRLLRFTVLKKRIPKKKFYSNIEKIAEDLGWNYLLIEKKYIIAHSQSLWSWSNRITIKHFHDHIMINIIPSPSFRTSVFTFGRKEQIFRFENALKDL